MGHGLVFGVVGAAGSCAAAGTELDAAGAAGAGFAAAGLGGGR